MAENEKQSSAETVPGGTRKIYVDFDMSRISDRMLDILIERLADREPGASERFRKRIENFFKTA